MWQAKRWFMFGQSVNRATENALPGAVGKTLLSDLGASKSQELGSDLATYGQVEDEQALPWRTPHTGVPGDLYKDVHSSIMCNSGKLDTA